MTKHADGNYIFHAPDQKSWRNWLKINHKKENGVWLILYKTSSGKSRVNYQEAVKRHCVMVG